MKILYFTSPGEDYLQDQVLIGLREIYDANVIDYPKKEEIYENFNKPKEEMYGCGFTIWKIMPDIHIDRENIIGRIKENEFDIIVFGSIRRQKMFFTRFRLSNIFNRIRSKICFLDGQDNNKLFIPSFFYGKYFKRELKKTFGLPFIRQINFSIPDKKIRQQPGKKINKFAKHVQCDEAYKIKEIKEYCQPRYAFSDEEAYYDDIAVSEYAVTMKKGGWECMRHYEIAANGTVPCFYKLEQKPELCAPHGLVDMKNVVAFNTADELEEKINYIKLHSLYPELQKNSLEWVRNNSCRQTAKRIVNQVLREKPLNQTHWSLDARG
ncbi:MAG: hypothetical protein GX846_02185 [Deltaproteobacteria bacterium]|nr:hypothetical protein [Deltaproteobacteria bacterium]